VRRRPETGFAHGSRVANTLSVVLVAGIAIVVALAIPALTRGSYSRLFDTRWHLSWLLFAGLGIQLVLEFASLPRDRWHDVGFGLLMASYVLILGFAFRNIVLRGMGVVIVGIACNAIAIGANQGMPVDIPPGWENRTWAEATVKHHPRQPDDKLVFLSDVIVLEQPFDTVLSFGDLIVAVGLCDLAFWASRKPKRRRIPYVDLVAAHTADDDAPTDDALPAASGSRPADDPGAGVPGPSD